MASEFLRALYPDWSEGWLVLWRNDTRASVWLAHDQLAGVESHVKTCADTKGANLYFGVGLQREKTKGRGTADNVLAIPGLWVDLDCAEAAAAKRAKKNYPSREVAEHCLQKLPLRPSVVVESGGGLHAYWLFHELLVGGADAARLVRGWQAVIAASLARLGGHDLDATHDLARVLRVPGSVNHTHGRTVRLADGYQDAEAWPRYEPADFEAYLVAEPEKPSASPVAKNGTGKSEHFSPASDPPTEKFDLLWEHSPEFQSIYRGRKAYASESERDCALCRYAVDAGWTDDEIASLLIARSRSKAPHRLDKLVMRGDYIPRTISKARSQYSQEVALASLNGNVGAQATPVDSLEPPAEKPTQSERAIVLNRLSVAMGIEVAGFIQVGRERPLYTLLLGTGDKISIGSAAAVLRGPNTIGDAVFAATGRLLQPITKQKWRGICENLARICEVVDADDASTTSTVRSVIGHYLSSKGIYGDGQRDVACATGDAFVEQGKLHLGLDKLRTFLRQKGYDGATKPETVNALYQLGFRPIPVGYKTASGKWVARRYWCGEAKDFEDELGEAAAR